MSQEQTIWSGTSSQIVNLGTYVLCILFFWLVIPIFIGIWKYLVVRTTKYELTTQRLRLRTGVLNKEINELELYRVKDLKIDQPLFLRIFSVANIVISTSDNSHPVVSIRAVSDAEGLLSKIRENVEIMRRNRVREVDMN
jgi:uncharacterized membrane protein YdbT with pleckstrin-like domain